jgi:hypothetical protein
MEYLIYVYFAMIAIFYSYVGYIWVKYGVLPSISDSWCHLPENQKILFTLFCWGFAFPAAIIGFTISDGNPFQFLMLFGAGGIMFVGAAPDIRNKKSLTRKVHYIAAVTGVIANTLYLYLVFPKLWIYPTIFVVGSLIMYALKRKVDEIWWIEILSFTSYAIVTGIIINKLLMLI